MILIYFIQVSKLQINKLIVWNYDHCDQQLQYKALEPRILDIVCILAKTHKLYWKIIPNLIECKIWVPVLSLAENHHVKQWDPKSGSQY